MKRQFAFIAFLLCAVLGMQGQVSHSDSLQNGRFYKFSFLGKERVPDALVYLPAPPSDKDALYKNDVAKYKWGKEQRETLRGDTAIMDARTDIPYLMQRFGWAIHKDITPDNCPQLAQLMRGVIQDIRGGMQNAKDYYARHRPYQVFKEHTSAPDYESDTDFTSYPSGHSVRAWALAMLFVALDPAHEDAIMKTGYDMGESRVILGYHFESDVEASRLCASAGFARLCAEPLFWAYLQLAREELNAVDSKE